MRSSFLLVTFFMSFLSAGPLSIRLGPTSRLFFPSVEEPPDISCQEDLRDIFLPSDPDVLIGAAFLFEPVPGFPLELSGSYVEYEPELRLGGSFPDSVVIAEMDCRMAVVSLGIRKYLDDIYLQAGSDILFYRGSWMEVDSASIGGYHRDYSGTAAGPFAGIGTGIPLSPVDISLDLRLHLPQFSGRWVSAGCTVLFH